MLIVENDEIRETGVSAQMIRTHNYSTCCVAIIILLCGASSALAQTAPSLGSADSFAVLGASTVTNTGPTVITGDLGVSPGNSITGFPPGSVVSGGSDAGGATSAAAQTSVTTAANALLAQACTTSFGPGNQDLGGLILTPGVYCFASSASITGTVTLNGQGNAGAVFIFRTGSTLITAPASSVVLINSAQSCNVFWRVGSSATLGTTTSFVGNILAVASITLNTSARIVGRALAQNGAVTLDSNTVSRSTCASTTPAPGTPGGSAICPAITLAPTTLPNGTVGVAYSQAITAGNGLASDTTYTFTLTGTGGLPPGLSLSSAGVISGTPLATGTGGTYNVTIRATDPSGCFGFTAFSMITVTAVPTLPEIFLVLLALGLMTIGYLRLRRGTPGAAAG